MGITPDTRISLLIAAILAMIAGVVIIHVGAIIIPLRAGKGWNRK